MKKFIIFDAYGTLFDVNAAARNYSKKTNNENFVSIWEKVSLLWREKQISYTWYYNSIGYKTNFWKVTEDALDFALEYYNLKENYNLRENLLSLYKKLDIFPEVLDVLKNLNAKNYKCAILSNGTMEMLNNAAFNSKINNYLEAILSAETFGLFKPNKKVYEMVLSQFSCNKKDVFFISSNGWDAAGGSAFGFSSLWINRNNLPEEKLNWKSNYTGNNLKTIFKFL